MSYDPYKSLYIHIPFCKRRCSYCDFLTYARDFDSPHIDEYVEKTTMQIREACKQGKLSDIETIYIGGGTPSYIGKSRLTNILYMISMSVKLDNVKEFTIEANPDSVDESLVKDIYALGVNRISIGVQSFDNNILGLLGRVHDSKQAENAIKTAQNRFENVSIDLMCGIPGQTLQQFEDSLKNAIDLGVGHISVYPLSIEDNTVFKKWTMQGRLPQIDEDQQADHMQFVHDYLTKNGFEHYEVSSFAKPGLESKHNLSYWTGKPYLGIGEAATTMTQNSERRMRVTDNHVEDDLNKSQMLSEDLMLAMRTKYGISKELALVAEQTFEDFTLAIDNLKENGFVEIKNGSIRPTFNGWLMGNVVFQKMMELQ